MTDYKKPLPQPDVISQTYWTAAKDHKLIIQSCTGCQQYVFYPREECPYCQSKDLEWVEVSGKGSVYSYTIVRRAAHPGFTNDVPYVYAIIELAEGPRLISNVIDCNIGEVQIGMPVTVAFEDVTRENTLVKFRPV